MSTNQAPPSPRPQALPNERGLILLFMAIQFTLVLDFMLLMPLGPGVMREMEIGAAGFGALVSCYSVSSAVFGISGALWVDRVPRGRLLIFLYLVFTGATAVCALATGPLVLTLGRVVAGASAGLLWAGVLACTIDVVPVERRGDAIGSLMSAYAMAAVLGVPLGLFTASRLGWRAPFAGLALGSLGLVILLHRFAGRLPRGRPDPAPRGTGAGVRSPSELARATFVSGWLLSFGVVCAGFLIIPYLGPFLTNNLDLTSDELAWVYLIGGSSTFVTSRLVGRAVDRAGPVRCLVLLAVGTLGAHLLLTHLTQATFAQASLCFTLFMTLTSGRMIPTVTLITERVPPHLRGRFLAVNTATTDLASGLASALGGALLATEGQALVGFRRVGWLAFGVTLLTLGVLAWHLRTRSAPPPASALTVNP